MVAEANRDGEFREDALLAVEGDDVARLLAGVIRQDGLAVFGHPSDDSHAQLLPVPLNALGLELAGLRHQHAFAGLGVDEEDADVVVGEAAMDRLDDGI